MYDLLLRNGNIITLEEDIPRANWVGVTNGKIEKVGVGQPDDDAGDVIDLGGNTVLPGLWDAHAHVMTTGHFLQGVNLEKVTCIQDVLDAMEERCRETPSGEWVFGGGFTSQYIKEYRFHTRKELDSISGDHPIMICSQTLHGVSLNTKAINLLDIPDVQGVGKYEDGSYDGTLLADDAALSVQSQVMGRLPVEKLEEFVRICTEKAASKGVTTLCGLMGQFVDGDVDVDIAMKGEFPVDIEVFYKTWDLEKVKAKGLPRIGGCLTLDGAGFEYTMANMRPYADKPERRGFLIHKDEEVYRLISEAHQQNIQTSFHALGERAIDQLLFCFKQVIGEQGNKDLRHRVEHFSLASHIHMDMLVEMNLIASMQPAFTAWDLPEGGVYEGMMGRRDADRMERFPDILDRGGIICGGSDSPVTPIDPLYGIANCVRSKNPARNISVTEALKIFTINAAYSVHKENEKGTIKVGKNADFTVIDRDPYDYAESDEIYDMTVIKTIRNGIITYSL